MVFAAERPGHRAQGRFSVFFNGVRSLGANGLPDGRRDFAAHAPQIAWGFLPVGKAGEKFCDLFSPLLFLLLEGEV